MPRLESAQYSYLRLAREVVATDALDEFLESARTISKDVFGIKGSPVNVKMPATREEELRPGHLTRYKGSGRANARVFAIESLRVTLFERRATPSHEVNEIIRKAYDRLDAPAIASGRAKRTMTGKREPRFRPNTLPTDLQQLEAVAGVTGQPVARVVEVVESTRPDYAFQGTEYSLRIKSDRIGKLLLDQAAQVETSARRIVVAQPLFRQEFRGEDDNPLYMQFMQVPNGSPDDHALFLESINENLDKLQRASEIELPLVPPIWTPKSVPTL